MVVSIVDENTVDLKSEPKLVSKYQTLLKQKYFYIENSVIIPIINLLCECHEKQIYNNAYDSIASQFYYLLLSWLENAPQGCLDPIIIDLLKIKLLELPTKMTIMSKSELNIPSSFTECNSSFLNSYKSVISCVLFLNRKRTRQMGNLNHSQFIDYLTSEKNLMNYYSQLLNSYLLSLILNSKEITIIKNICYQHQLDHQYTHQLGIKKS